MFASLRGHEKSRRYVHSLDFCVATLDLIQQVFQLSVCDRRRPGPLTCRRPDSLTCRRPDSLNSVTILNVIGCYGSTGRVDCSWKHADHSCSRQRNPCYALRNRFVALMVVYLRLHWIFGRCWVFVRR